MKNVKVALHLEQPRYDALQRLLKRAGTDLETAMQARLEEFYLQVIPLWERQAIRKRLEETGQATKHWQEIGRQISAFHVVENGQISDFVSRQPMEFLETAHLLRQYLREELPFQAPRFIDCVPSESWLTKDQFQDLAERRIQNPRRIVGVFSLNFDEGEVSLMDPFEGWKRYEMRDVSGAAGVAFHEELESGEERWAKFLDHLDGLEITRRQDDALVLQMV